MKIAMFSTKGYDRRFFDELNADHDHQIQYFESRLTPETSPLVEGFDAVCPFVNDQVDAQVLQDLADRGVRLIATRSAGFNHIDLQAADRLGIAVAHVPAYSPHAVAEHTLALILGLNRNIHRAHNRVRERNFSLDGLLGFDLHQKTVGIIGTGQIGTVFAHLMTGFGCQLLASDPYPSEECRDLGVTYVDTDELFERSHVISLHCPLTPKTHHLIDAGAIDQMRDDVMLINTSRGALIDTRAVIDGLKDERIGHLGLDVYEEEADLFFEDLSDRVIQDDVFARLLTFPNVLITGHQGFFTREALTNIADTTLSNFTAFATDGAPLHPVTVERIGG